VTAAKAGGAFIRKLVRVAVILLFVTVFISLIIGEATDTEPQQTEQTVKPETALATIPAPQKEAEAEYIPPAAEVEALAKMLYGEARGVTSDMEKAACVWVVLNRVDDPRYPDTVLEVLEAPAQFAGYSQDNPIAEELKTMAADVLTRHHAEKTGATDVGRVIPREYLFFTGDGERNYFTAEWNSADTWGWNLENPYEKERTAQ